jgi:hypothetical protein
MQSDYNRNMDALRADKQQVEAAKQKQLDWYKDELIKFNEYTQVVDEYKQLKAAAGGDNGDNGDRKLTTSVGDVVTKKDLEEMLGKRDGQVISIVKGAMRYATDHLHKFGEPLDPDALEKIAVDNNLPLNLAYEKLIAPKLAERQQADFKKQIDDAKAEGAREFASTHKIPVDTKPREPHMIFDHKAPAADAPKPGSAEFERNLRGAFVDEWNKQPAATT